MIYTVTLSPSLDYAMWMDHVNPGALNRASATGIRPGGKGINVSVVLNRLGVESVCLGFLAGFVGKEIERLVEKEGVQSQFIDLAEGCSRINVKVKSDTETELNAYGPEVMDPDMNRMMRILEKLTVGDILVLSGNPSKGVSADIYAEIMKTVIPHGVRVILDTSGKYLESGLCCHPYLIKPNLDELRMLCGRTISADEEIIEACRYLQSLGALNILVSLGEGGAVFVTENGECYRCGIPKGTLVNSTGAGDSMIAGFITKDFENALPAEKLRFSVACGSASTYSPDLLTREDAESYYLQTPIPEMIP